MDYEFNSLLSIAIIPNVIELIVKNEGRDEISAMSEFYNSKPYAMLVIEETKMWHYSPMNLYSIWKHEKETGTIAYPEE